MLRSLVGSEMCIRDRFEMAVTSATVSPGAVMCSYNAVNGEPMCTNSQLIAGKLRQEFGFDGLVATDCGALEDAWEHHHRYKRPVDAAAAAIHAGVDSNCGSVLPSSLGWAIGNGSLSEADLDVTVARLLAARFKLGLFDEQDLPQFEIGEVDTERHRDLALDAARQGVVLLQNNVLGAKAKLPLSKTKYKTVGMLGPNANASMNLLSGYHGSPPFLVSPLAGMSHKWGSANVKYSLGCNVSINQTPPEEVQAEIDRAVQVSKEVDVIVLGLGLCGDNYGGGPPGEDSTCYKIDESEGIDRPSLALPGAQLRLFRAVQALEKPLVVFVMNAGPVDLTEIRDSKVPIVAVGYGGEFGGQATADVLAGDYNPGGATTVTWYPDQITGLVSFREMSLRSNRSNPGRTYRFLDENKLAPIWRFGHGLSYTVFGLEFEDPINSTVDMNSTVEWKVRVRNTGTMAGGVVVVCYVAAVDQAVVRDPPFRSVFDFERVEGLDPQTNTTLRFPLTPRGRSLVDEQGVRVTPPGVYSVWCQAGAIASTSKISIIVK
eukprot:TRINITY_DN10976_c0_g1_i1.p1 TRINITY_DN10976_c0_g1~~TRINITY_DN10976_c0_g1_i1.p1  ORF type:complete len:580 (+),score=146.98 TRINITY_DN10976_c0_g1_i1:105-1742(+)